MGLANLKNLPLVLCAYAIETHSAIGCWLRCGLLLCRRFFLGGFLGRAFTSAATAARIARACTE
ncbi:MAG TPA: hypothetical protein VGC60_09390 [Pyrinomonadaceae bacterium]|jgi:hypothetical protein